MDLLARFFRDESGAVGTEYAVLLASIAIATSVLSFGTATKGLFDQAVARYPAP